MKVKRDEFVWFPGEALLVLGGQIAALPHDAAGVPQGRLEIHGSGRDTTLHIVASGDVVAEGGGGGTNEAHICPPVCP